MAAPRLEDQLEFVASMPEARADAHYLEHTVNRLRSDAPADHRILGVTVTLQAGERLHKALHTDRASQKIERNTPPPDVRSLTILCDTLYLNSPLCVPQADVKIFAREIVFGPGAFIDTSPLEWRSNKARDASETGGDGESGAHGRNAGSLTVMCKRVWQGQPGALKRLDVEPNRLIANGGRGQDAGEGKNGEDGVSRRVWYGAQYSYREWPFGTTTFKPKFDPPAYYYKADIHVLSKISAASDQEGQTSPPTSGTDAVPPGLPGNAGDAGLLTTNQADLLNCYIGEPGRAGREARDVRGGRGGSPTKSGKYEMVWYYDVTGSDDGSVEYTSRATTTTTDGVSHSAKSAAKTAGAAPRPVFPPWSHAWLHPQLLRHMRMFIRDLYLSGDLERTGALLEAYEEALLEGVPDQHPSAEWTPDAAPEWAAGAAEIATLRNRLTRKEDYFGNPAGWAPLLSLQGSMRAYDLEAESALRTLLLARWVSSKAKSQANAAAACDEAIGVLTANSAKVAAEMDKSREALAGLEASMRSVSDSLDKTTVKLLELNTKLTNQASATATKKAHIKAAINMGAALLQVIPVGQPALGALGNLATVAADFNDKDPADSIKKAGDSLTSSLTAAKEAKSAAEKAIKAAVKEAKEEGKTDEEIAAIRDKKPSMLAKAGAGVGPAIGMVSKALGSLQVSRSEIDAELEKLKANSPEWEAISEDLKALIEKKATFFAELTSTIQKLGEGYARVTTNASAVVTLGGQRGAALASLDPAALQAIADLDQRARTALTANLYLLVRAYETTAFKPAEVNWAMGQVFDRIEALLNQNKDKDVQTVLAEAKALAPIFEANLKTLRDRLLADGLLQTQSMTMELTLGPDHLAELNLLNDQKPVDIDPVRRNLLLPRYHRDLLSKVVLDEIVFEEGQPRSGNAILTLTAGTAGIVRMNQHLFGVRRDAPIVWTWTYGFSGKKLTPTTPSLSSLDLLNMLLKSTDVDIRQKFALPPLWSDLSLEYTYSDLPDGATPPRIARLVFSVQIERAAARADQIVLDLRSTDPDAEVMLSSEDLGGRRDGAGDFHRIYSRGATVEMKAKASTGWVFDHWEVAGQAREGAALTVDLKKDQQVRLVCRPA